jgi:hypothetical protein
MKIKRIGSSCFLLVSDKGTRTLVGQFEAYQENMKQVPKTTPAKQPQKVKNRSGK